MSRKKKRRRTEQKTKQKVAKASANIAAPVLEPSEVQDIKDAGQQKHERKKKSRRARALLDKLNGQDPTSRETYSIIRDLLDLKEVLPAIIAERKRSPSPKDRVNAEEVERILASPQQWQRMIENWQQREYFEEKKREILSKFNGQPLEVVIPVDKQGPRFSEITTSFIAQRLEQVTRISELQIEDVRFDGEVDCMGQLRGEVFLPAGVTFPLEFRFIPPDFSPSAFVVEHLLKIPPPSLDAAKTVSQQITEIIRAADAEVDLKAKNLKYLEAMKLMLEQGYYRTARFTDCLSKYASAEQMLGMSIKLAQCQLEIGVDLNENGDIAKPITRSQILARVASQLGCRTRNLKLVRPLPDWLGQFTMQVYYGEQLLGSITLEIVDKQVKGKITKEISSYYYSQALLHKQNKRSEKARLFFEEAIKHEPTLDVYSSYAAFEKVSRNIDKAGEIYKRGIKQYPFHSKLYEEYGMLEYKSGNYTEAVDIFRAALAKARLNRPRIGVFHRLIAQAFMQIGGPQSYAKAREHFEIAKRRGVLSSEQHETQYNVAKLRTGHARGGIALDFLQAAGLEVTKVFPPRGDAADFLIRPITQDYVESYDLVEMVLVRCFFKTAPEYRDLRNLAQTFEQVKKRHALNEDVIFIIASDMSNIQDRLYRLTENPSENRLLPDENITQSFSIVPFKEQDIQRGLESETSEAVFRQVLDNWLYRRDLYADKRPVSGRKFYGREQSLRDIEASIEDGNHVGIFGLRKVGKTSLLRQLEIRRARDLVTMVDLQAVPPGIEDCKYLYMLIANELALEIRDKYPRLTPSLSFKLAGKYRDYTDLPELSIVTSYFDHDIRAVQRLITEQDELIQMIVPIDEVDLMLPTDNRAGYKGYVGFFRYLRGLSQQYRFLVSVVAAANPLICETPQWDGQDNPVFNFYRKIFLPPLEREECDTMVTKLGRGMGITYDGESLARIHEYTGGHPYITRELCSQIIKRFKERPLEVDETKVEEGVKEYLFNESSTLQEIMARLGRDFPEEKEILVTLARAGAPVTTSELKRQHNVKDDALRHLVGYQLIERAGETYQIKIALLRVWLRKKWLNLED